MSELEIRETTQADTATLVSLYPEAFPDEDLVPLVRDLLQDPSAVLSLVGTMQAKIAGHVIFTPCGVDGNDVKAALLAPLAVLPGWQRQGIGSALVRSGLHRLQGAGVTLVCVLGDPAYYGRLGFRRESSIEPPYPLPKEWDGAWQSQYLGETTTRCEGKLLVPPRWQEPALWAP